MHHDELSARERAVLFALLSAARKLSNQELEALIGIRLTGKERRKLNELKLVESEKPGRWFVHELSDAGWQWCADELLAGPAGRPTSLERAHYLIFGVFERYMSAAGLSLADVASLDLKVRPAGRHKRRDAAEGDGDLTARVARLPRRSLPAAANSSTSGNCVSAWRTFPGPRRTRPSPRCSPRRVNLVPHSNGRR